MNTPITKVICKKPFRKGGDNIYVDFKIGVTYDKFNLETDAFFSDPKVPYKYKYIYIYDEHGGYRFHLNKNVKYESFPNFYDYFYDQKELRKLKLEKINENNRNR